MPVRFHDFRSLTSRTNPDFLEFHLSFKDLEEKFERFIDSVMPRFSGPVAAARGVAALHASSD